MPPIDGPGEVGVHEDFVAKRYWPADRVNLAGGHWFRTGDVGRIDREGFLYLVDRKKDVIIPLSAMGKIHDETMFLKLNKHQIESLPTFPVHRRWS